MLYLHQKQASA